MTLGRYDPEGILLLLLLLLLLNVFDNVPVCRRVTDESWALIDNPYPLDSSHQAVDNCLLTSISASFEQFLPREHMRGQSWES